MSELEKNDKDKGAFDFFDLDNLDLTQELADQPSGRGVFGHEFLTGAAGTGKTYQIRKRLEEDPGYARLAATTGIAALNMGVGVTTINSLLGFYNLDSLKESYQEGRLGRKLRYLYKDDDCRNIVIDEVSMLGKETLQILHDGFRESAEGGCPIGMILTGDFCQLPPVKAEWAFRADCWGEFAQNLTRLTKIWRQSDEKFLGALNSFRSGLGRPGAEALLETPVQIADKVDDRFDGTTVFAKNDDVDRHNDIRLGEISKTPFKLGSFRWGRTHDQRETNQWKDIPQAIVLKDTALVMILTNDQSKPMRYANGSQGHVVGYNPETKSVDVELVHSGEVVSIGPLLRQAKQKEIPPEWAGKKRSEWPLSRKEAIKYNHPFDLTYYDPGDGARRDARWIIGEILYYPLRLAWGTTVHKSQGLSLDKIQVDIRDRFFGSPAMEYVAFSRCKSPEGLRIVTTGPNQIASRCSIDPAIKEWL